MSSGAAYIGLPIWAIQAGGAFCGVLQHAECLLVVAHSGVYKLAIGAVELLCLGRQLADLAPCRQAAGRMPG